MSLVRMVLERNPNGVLLLAQFTLSEKEISRIKTKLLLGYEVIETYDTSVFWYNNAGHPPKPWNLHNPKEVAAICLESDKARRLYLNQTQPMKWIWEVRVFDNADNK